MVLFPEPDPPTNATLFFSKVVGGLILWLAAIEVFALNMTIGQLIAFNMLLSMFQQPLNQLKPSANKIKWHCNSSHQGYFWGDIIHDKKSNE
jgi:ABC-type multidrug transport system fused ATPase/permease subunit